MSQIIHSVPLRMTDSTLRFAIANENKAIKVHEDAIKVHKDAIAACQLKVDTARKEAAIKLVEVIRQEALFVVDDTKTSGVIVIPTANIDHRLIPSREDWNLMKGYVPPATMVFLDDGPFGLMGLVTGSSLHFGKLVTMPLSERTATPDTIAMVRKSALEKSSSLQMAIRSLQIGEVIKVRVSYSDPITLNRWIGRLIIVDDSKW